MEQTGSYGFRYDTMNWLENDRSLQAAVVRKLLFGSTNDGDENTIEAHFKEQFGLQKSDGSLHDEYDQGILEATGSGLVRLLEMGCSPDRPEMARAFDAIENAIAKLHEASKDDVSIYSLRALCTIGATSSPAIAASLKRLAKDIDNMLGEGCPWTPEVQLNALWAGKDVCNFEVAIDRGLAWIRDALEPPGCGSRLGLCMPWSMVQLVGVIDAPISAEIARKLVPMLLRLQKPDGGWGDEEGMSSFWAFKALTRYGLLDELRERQPLPPDWRVVRSIPFSAGEGFPVIAADGGNIWGHNPEEGTATLISAADGSQLRTCKLAKNGPFGAWDGALWVLDERTLNRLDPETGKITQQIWAGADTHPFRCMVRVGKDILVPDAWEGGVWVIDPTESVEPKMIRLAAGMPDYIASGGEDIWAVDSWAGALIHSDEEGNLLDWGEQPFGWASIAWDGEELWALDRANDRICLVEKNVPAN